MGFKKYLISILKYISLLRQIIETQSTQNPITFRLWFFQKVIGFNRKCYWPVHHSSVVNNPEYIYIGIDSSPGYMNGCYIQGSGKIYIGNYVQIGPNVGIISSNHSLYDSRESEPKPVVIGDYCWLAMGVTVMPGVILGPHVTVGSGAVVTKSFESGYCVIAGNPAKKIKDLDPTLCVNYENDYKYHGYLSEKKYLQRIYINGNNS
ncbi:MAG: acyltransferase [Bacteroidota bacterium]|jgi:acetyltransferase-like isoleucine patch superfamily enzyme